MEIKNYRLDRSTIETFADLHGLTMEVHERHGFESDYRFYAHFEGAEIKEGCCLASVFGNGRTPAEAISDYGKEISGKLLVLRAMTPERKEIHVPIIEV